MTQSAKRVTWQTSSEYRRLAVPSGRPMNYVSFAQKIQIPEIFGFRPHTSGSYLRDKWWSLGTFKSVLFQGVMKRKALHQCALLILKWALKHRTTASSHYHI